MTEQQSNFEGWAIVEIFGHQKYAGKISSQVFGTAVMLRLDVPALEEREKVLKRTEYTDSGPRLTLPAGSTVKQPAVQGYTKLFGIAAVYSLTPCEESAAMAALEELQPRPMTLVRLPEAEKAIAAAASREYHCCNGNPEAGHELDCLNAEENQDDAEEDEEDDLDDFNEPESAETATVTGPVLDAEEKGATP